MLTGIIIIAVVGLLAVLSHRRTRLENRIYKNVPLVDWLNVAVYPVALYIGWFFLVKNILSRPNINIIPLGDFDILAITMLFTIYGFMGSTIHFTGKILWRYLKGQKYSMAFRVNEMFHGRLSHYLVYLSTIFIIFLLAILEINHPVAIMVSVSYLLATTLGGIIFGYAGSRTIFYTNEWFGGYNKPLFFINTVLLIILLSGFRSYRLNFAFYPVSLFIAAIYTSAIASFLLRQFFIFARLGNKRKLRFLAKIFSA